MIPKIGNRGHSFKGLTQYLLYGSNGQDQARVAFTKTGNLHTQDLEAAAKVMAWTDRYAEDIKHDAGVALSGRKSAAGPVYHYSLSWALNEKPDQAHMTRCALETLARLGLEENQYYIVAHNDTRHAHIHVVANLTHPKTGRRIDTGLDKRALQDWALSYEQEHGIHCTMRVQNALEREQGRATKHQDRKQDYARAVTRAYFASDNGRAFVQALEAEGLKLAVPRRGNGFVIVSQDGRIQKLNRQLELDETGRAKTKAIQDKLSDLKRDALPDADVLSKRIKEGRGHKNGEGDQGEQPFDRDAYHQKQQEAIDEAGIKHARLLERLKRDALRRRVDEIVDKRLAHLEHQDTYRRPWIGEINAVYRRAPDGRAFQREIKKDLELELVRGTQGKLCVVDRDGRIHTLNTAIHTQDTEPLKQHIMRRAHKDPDVLEDTDRLAIMLYSEKRKQLDEDLKDINRDKLMDAQKAQAIIRYERYHGLALQQEKAVARSKELWRIKDHEADLKVVQEDLDGLNRLPSAIRLVLKAKREEQEDLVRAKTEALEDAKTRWADDIRSIYSRAPDIIVRQKLSDAGVPDRSYARDEKTTGQALQSDRDMIYVHQEYEKDRKKLALCLQERSVCPAREETIEDLRASLRFYEENFGVHLAHAHDIQSQNELRSKSTSQDRDTTE